MSAVAWKHTGTLFILLAMSFAAAAQDVPAQDVPAQDASSTTPSASAPAASTSAPAPTAPVVPSPTGLAPVEDKRIFGVLPNNRTTENSIPFAPITSRQKLTIAFKDSFDWPVYPTAGAFALLYQLENSNPSYGQGMKGYAKRWASAYADQMIGNMMTEGIMPSLLHQDPRYFRLGTGSKKTRLKYALWQIVSTKTDSGHRTFNFSEFGGNAVATAISNAYYPDSRTASDNVQKWGIAIATDTFSNVLKEFWPDIKQYLQRKRHHVSGD